MVEKASGEGCQVVDGQPPIKGLGSNQTNNYKTKFQKTEFLHGCLNKHVLGNEKAWER